MFINITIVFVSHVYRNGFTHGREYNEQRPNMPFKKPSLIIIDRFNLRIQAFNAIVEVVFQLERQPDRERERERIVCSLPILITYIDSTRCFRGWALSIRLFRNLFIKGYLIKSSMAKTLILWRWFQKKNLYPKSHCFDGKQTLTFSRLFFLKMIEISKVKWKSLYNCWLSRQCRVCYVCSVFPLLHIVLDS